MAKQTRLKRPRRTRWRSNNKTKKKVKVKAKARVERKDSIPKAPIQTIVPSNGPIFKVKVRKRK